MEFLIGFGIAIMIGLTGVGGGVITAPVLTLFLGVPPAQAIGTALVFSAVVKAIVAPAYLLRRQVDFRILAYLLAGGLPGVILGSILLQRLSAAQRKGPLLAVLGGTVVVMALMNLYRASQRERVLPVRDRARWLPWIAFPIGAEVGFSSAGAGALGSLALMSLTSIPPASVVGTDVLFGLGLSLAGGGISLSAGNIAAALAIKLSIGGIVGAFVGANLLSLIPSRPLRVILSLWLVSLGAQLCWRAFAP
jgi:uncharacterized membrane protein YfcA